MVTEDNNKVNKDKSSKQKAEKSQEAATANQQVNTAEKQEVKESNKEAELNNKLLRMAAEIENLRKRNEQQVKELQKYAISDFAKEVIGVLENFYLIIDNAPDAEIQKSETIKKFYDGIKITHNDLLKLFEKNGIKRIYPLGEKFNHDNQQVVSQIKSDKASGTVIQVIQAGYMLNDRLLKEALVVVAQ